MKVPITALSARATTGVLGQRLWGDWDLHDLRADNPTATLDVWERELEEAHRGVLMDDIFNDDKYIKYDLLATYAHEEGVPMDAKVDLYIKGNIKELYYVGSGCSYRNKGVKLYTKKKDKVIKGKG
jgi:hypothetical protein